MTDTSNRKTSSESARAISLSKSYRTRDGREVRLLMVDGGGPSPVIGAWRYHDNHWVECAWWEDGRHAGEDLYLIEQKPRIKREAEETSMIDWTKPIETRDGYRAHLLHTLLKAYPNDERRVVLFADKNGEERILILNDAGQIPAGPVMIRNVPPPRRKVWVAVNHAEKPTGKSAAYTTNAYATKQCLLANISNHDNWTFHEIEIDGSL